ncbi:MAG: aldehyde dehydrogenase family protein [Myxococcota bacterium]
MAIGNSRIRAPVAMACAERLIPCTLELGGKDPAIVLEDADIDRTANGLVWGAFFNAGQTCISIERAYVVEDVYDELVDAVVRLTQSLRQGIDTGDYDIDVGSMIFPAQTDIVDRHVQDAIDKGATLRTGGRRNLDLPEGYFYEPTVLTDVNHDMLILTEETFGPVLPIMKVRDAEEALRYANDSDCGLSSSVWTRSQERGRAIARRLQSGSVCINETICNYLALEAPFGGVKHSGIGHRKTAEELRAYCHEKTVLEDIFRLKTEPWWYPYSPALGNGALKAIGLFYRSGLTHKIRALLS